MSEGKTVDDAKATVEALSISEQNETLFGFGINYSKLHDMHRKGSILVPKAAPLILHVDMTSELLASLLAG